MKFSNERGHGSGFLHDAAMKPAAIFPGDGEMQIRIDISPEKMIYCP